MKEESTVEAVRRDDCYDSQHKQEAKFLEHMKMTSGVGNRLSAIENTLESNQNMVEKDNGDTNDKLESKLNEENQN